VDDGRVGFLIVHRLQHVVRGGSASFRKSKAKRQME
jgi:hypothetical protein